MSNKKLGFTLVELSIVLVIIGLLIGGILAAQSMIETAKIQSLVRQISQFDAAVENFQTKYGGLPGDSTKLGCDSSAQGQNHTCDDGKVLDSQDQYLGADANQITHTPTFSGETGKFWYDLSLDGLINPGGSKYTDCTDGCNLADASAPGQYAPVINLSRKSVLIAFCAFCDPASPIRNYYLVGANLITGNANDSALFRPIQMLALDKKIDNGINDVSSNPNFLVGSAPDSSADSIPFPPCSVNGTYMVTHTRTVCTPLIRMGASTGDLH